MVVPGPLTAQDALSCTVVGRQLRLVRANVCTDLPRWNMPEVHCCAPVYSPTSPRRRLGEISLIYRRAAQSSYGSM